MKISLLFLATLVTLFTGCKSSVEVQPQQSILGFSPKQSMVGEIVTIYGKDFPTDTARVHVLLDSIGAEIISLSPDSIQIRVPDTASTAPIIVQLNSKALSTTDSFTVLDGIYFYPKQVNIGDSVTVYSKPAPLYALVGFSRYSAAQWVNARKLGPASLRAAVIGGEPKRLIAIHSNGKDLHSSDSLELLPNTNQLQSVAIEIKDISASVNVQTYDWPFDTLTSSITSTKTVAVNLSFSDWYQACTDSGAGIPFCMSKSTSAGSESISGYLVLDTIAQVISELKFSHHSYYLHNGYPNSPYDFYDAVAIKNIPYNRTGNVITAVSQGVDCNNYITTIESNSSKTDRGQIMGTTVKSSASNAQATQQTSLKITIVKN